MADPPGAMAFPLSDFDANGVAVVPGFLSAEEVSALNAQIGVIVEQQRLAEASRKAKTFFTTNEQARHTDDEFMESAHSIRLFYEVHDAAVVNKVGHALHVLDPVFREVSYSQKVRDLVHKDLRLKCPVPVQSMFINKASQTGGRVDAHQDSTFIISEPDTCHGLWFALADATIENGCLFAEPGSHKKVPSVARRFVRQTDAATGAFVGMSFDKQAEYSLSECVPLEVTAGTLVVLHGGLLHFSHENTSGKSRPAYSIHLYDAASSAWSAKNWIQDVNFFPPYEQ